jgi:hypothetical protein
MADFELARQSCDGLPYCVLSQWPTRGTLKDDTIIE